MPIPRSPWFATTLVATFGLYSCGAGSGAGSGVGAARATVRDVIAVASAPAELIANLSVGPAGVERLGADAETGALAWAPSDADLKALVTARRVLLLGNEFEPWAQRAGLPPSRTITLAGGLSPDAVLTTATVSHTHGQGPAHSHGGAVPTTWTDPALLRAMVHGAGELLTGVLETPEGPGAADAAVARHQSFGEELLAYEEALEALKSKAAGRRLFAVAHGLEYIARAAEMPLLVTLLEIEAGGGRNDHAAALLEQAASEPGHAGVLVWPGPIDEDFAKVAKEQLALTSVRVELGYGGDGDGLIQRLTQSVTHLTAAIAGE